MASAATRTKIAFIRAATVGSQITLGIRLRAALAPLGVDLGGIDGIAIHPDGVAVLTMFPGVEADPGGEAIGIRIAPNATWLVPAQAIETILVQWPTQGPGSEPDPPIEPATPRPRLRLVT